MERRGILFFSFPPNLNPSSLSLNLEWQNEVLQPQSGQQHVPYYNLYAVFWASGIVASISYLLGKYLSHQAWSQSCWSDGLVVRDSFTASREKFLKLMFTYFAVFTFLAPSCIPLYLSCAFKEEEIMFIHLPARNGCHSVKLLSLSPTVRGGARVCKISQLTVGSPAATVRGLRKLGLTQASLVTSDAQVCLNHCCGLQTLPQKGTGLPKGLCHICQLCVNSLSTLMCNA